MVKCQIEVIVFIFRIFLMKMAHLSIYIDIK